MTDKPLRPRVDAAATGQAAPGVIEWSDVRSDVVVVPSNELTRNGAISATDIAWCADVAGPRRMAWAKAGDLKDQPPFAEHDALETALAFSLAKAGVSQKIARSAWRLIRPDVKKLLIAGERGIWIVVGPGGRRAWALANAEDVARHAAGQGACWVISAEGALREANVRYGQVRDRRAPDGQLAQLPQRRTVRRSE